MPIWYLVIIFCNSDGKEAYSLFYIIKYLYIIYYTQQCSYFKFFMHKLIESIVLIVDKDNKINNFY